MNSGPATCPRLPGCNPIISATHPETGWQAWCARCHWEGPGRAEVWQARKDKQHRQAGAATT